MTVFVRHKSQMIRKLRRKFVATAMSALLILLILLLGFINIFYLVEIDRNANGLLQMLLDNRGTFPVDERMPAFAPEESEQAENTEDTEVLATTEAEAQTWDSDGVPPGPPMNFESMYREEAPFETRYFVVFLDDGSIAYGDLSHIAAVTQDQANGYALAVTDKGMERGYYGAYKYGVTTLEDGLTMIVFIDCSSRLSSAMQLFEITLIFGGISLVIMFVLVYLLSGIAVSSAAESMDKQKRFISDAGHELKTPLSVISATVDVLEMDSGRNEWTGAIRNQVRRMTDLVNNMLALSRLEESSSRELFSQVDLSQCVQESVETYRLVAAAKDRRFDARIAPNIQMRGESKSLSQLFSILLDNAMKYSNEGGSIRICLTKDEKAILFDVTNTCDVIPEENLERLFDRFYRADSSRSRESGGYGIGLSVAKAICENHGGTIAAQRTGAQEISFVVRFPLARVLD